MAWYWTCPAKHGILVTNGKRQKQENNMNNKQEVAAEAKAIYDRVEARRKKEVGATQDKNGKRRYGHGNPLAAELRNSMFVDLDCAAELHAAGLDDVKTADEFFVNADYLMASKAYTDAADAFDAAAELNSAGGKGFEIFQNKQCSRSAACHAAEMRRLQRRRSPQEKAAARRAHLARKIAAADAEFMRRKASGQVWQAL